MTMYAFNDKSRNDKKLLLEGGVAKEGGGNDPLIQ